MDKIKVMFAGLVLSPLHFFSISFDLSYFAGKKELPPKRHYLLPNMSQFSDIPPFADVYLAWSEEGIFCTIESKIKAEECSTRDYRRGDSVELFIDTRASSQVKFPTKFCHHFVFFPGASSLNDVAIQGMEITRFRGEEMHPLADPSLFTVTNETLRKGYLLKIFIPSEALFGYDPSQNKRIGFAYRINSLQREPQFFSVDGDDVAIEANPALWASVNLGSKR